VARVRDGLDRDGGAGRDGRLRARGQRGVGDLVLVGDTGDGRDRRDTRAGDEGRRSQGGQRAGTANQDLRGLGLGQGAGHPALDQVLVLVVVDVEVVEGGDVAAPARADGGVLE